MNKRFYFFMMFVVTFILVFYYVSNTNHIDTKMVVNYNGNNLRISIDGVESTTLPTSGNYYLVDYTCKSASTTVSWDRTTYQLKVSNQNKEGGVACYLDFQSSPKLADMPVGSYVAYTGNNGCSGESCNGKNANYVSDAEMGYCYSSNYKFIVNGWRIGYTKNKTAYLVSAGATDCMCTNSSGTASSSSCSDYLSASDLYKHFDNMNVLSLKYCNQDFSYGGVCDETTVWAMKADDFQNIVGKALSSSSCFNKYSDRTCGYTNDLIDNGGYYWFATVYGSSSANTFLWYPNAHGVHYSNSSNSSNGVYGVRPVLRLESSVQVADGSGTYEDPYVVANNTFLIDEASIVSDGEGSSVTLRMVGYNASQMCINLNSSGCSNYIDFSDSYVLDLSDAVTGNNIIYVYYKDGSGTVIATMQKTITLGS